MNLASGTELHNFAAELFPGCRSITGDGLRWTLRRIAQRIPLEITEVPSGEKVFDWTIPPEWTITDAWVADARGRRIINFQENNLHVLNYSIGVHARMRFSELRPHLSTLPHAPELIPYRTSYYHRNWGFCLAHSRLAEFNEDEEYDVCIDASHTPGYLTYGECVVRGESEDEVLISAHCCHPSLANDNLSGITVATHLALALLQGPRPRHTWRFLFVPATVGSLAWLARNSQRTHQIQHGLVLTCIGNQGAYHYKQSRRGTATIDRAMAHLLRHCSESSEIMPFTPVGYDERQFCSPGFDLPVGCLMRGVHGTFPEYHTSADNLDFLSPAALEGSLALLDALAELLSNDGRFQNLSPFGEPQLGKRGLFRATGGEIMHAMDSARLWILNLSDGSNSLLDIAERAQLPFSIVLRAAKELRQAGLLQSEEVTV